MPNILRHWEHNKIRWRQRDGLPCVRLESMAHSVLNLSSQWQLTWWRSVEGWREGWRRRSEWGSGRVRRGTSQASTPCDILPAAYGTNCKEEHAKLNHVSSFQGSSMRCLHFRVLIRGVFISGGPKMRCVHFRGSQNEVCLFQGDSKWGVFISGGPD